MVDKPMATLSMPSLLALTIALDVLIASITVPLQRASLNAAHQNAPAMVILALLGANVALLGLVVCAMYANSRLVGRLFSSQLGHKNPRGREEVSLLCDTCANASKESGPRL
jgi:hypothetical protein